MGSLYSKSKMKVVSKDISLKKAFQNEDGAIDLASIMVGIIVVGLIGGVIAATVFAVIPWAQDNAAKQQLDSVVQAENAYFGLSTDPSGPLPSGTAVNSFTDSTGLASANLMTTPPTVCVIAVEEGKGYVAYAKSASGKIFEVSDEDSVVSEHTGSFMLGCESLVPYVDPTPKRTVLTYRCDTAATVVIPMSNGQKGTETWSDGVTRTYVNGEARVSRTLDAGVTYTLTFEGTYKTLSNSMSIAPCLRSMDHWGLETGVVIADNAFMYSTNLTSVPAHLPPTVTSTKNMFHGTNIFNDPNVSRWDTTNVTNMEAMFLYAIGFNQSLNNWNTTNVTDMSNMFQSATVFNQPVNNWNTANVTDMSRMFSSASAFNQPLNDWSTAKVTTLNYMFYAARDFNQPLDKWDTSKVTDFGGVFHTAGKFNQPLNSWNVSQGQNFSNMFWAAGLFDRPLDSWTLTNATDLSSMFRFARSFNQPLATWNVSKVTKFEYMFDGTTNIFNQNLSSWNTASLVTGNNFAKSTFNSAYLPTGTTLSP